MKPIEQEAAERFWPKVCRAGPDECWLWAGKTHEGYGYLTLQRQGLKAHRASAILHGLDVRPRMHVDHMCRNRRCVNPAHLRVVTPRVNVLENSASVTAVNARKTHCKNGHALTPDNLCKAHLRKGWRDCATCHRLNRRKARAKARAASLTTSTEKEEG